MSDVKDKVEEAAHAAEDEVKKADAEVKQAVAEAVGSDPAKAEAPAPSSGKPAPAPQAPANGTASSGSDYTSYLPWIGIALGIAVILAIKYFGG